MYALTDPTVITLLKQKGAEGVETTIFYDPSASGDLQAELDGFAYAFPLQIQGLMHRKILVIDGQWVFLGSVNLTTQSLTTHDNLLLGMFQPQLGQFLKSCSTPSFPFTIQQQAAELWLLPDHENEALSRLLGIIDQAKHSIHIAMFTLTHPLLVKALIDAHQRGVVVSLSVDFYTGHGASLKALESLQRAGITTHLSQGQQLLHHKWALIDETTFILGSANWTKAAFSNNQDCFIILHKISAEQKKFLNSLWKTIVIECN